MTAQESPDALLRRAADRLDALDRKASEGPWYVGNGTGLDDIPLMAGRGDRARYLCASPDDGVRGGHLAPDAALIVALRPMIPLLASTLRDVADDVATFGQHHADPVVARWEYAEREYPHEMAAARAVLGEPVGGEGRG